MRSFHLAEWPWRSSFVFSLASSIRVDTVRISMSAVQDIEKDLFELSQLRAKSQRTNIQTILDKYISEYCDKLKEATEEAKKNGPTSDSSEAPLVQAPVKPGRPRPKTKLTTYAYDESDKYMKLYITIPGVHNVPAEKVSVQFQHNGVEMLCEDVNGKDYELKIVDLAGEILPEKSLFKQKTDMVLLMMKKSKEGEKWEAVIKSGKKEKKMPEFNENGDPQESMMNLMKTMYEEGDDEMKRQIKKSMYESRQKNPGAGF
uniref:Calcyclin-binding protein n=2 Tax=Steinernema glaseri TaxID=37863 RepID=A0A1I8AGI7_9BILA